MLKGAVAAFCLIVPAALWVTVGARSAQQPPESLDSATVTKIIDGDTLEVVIGDQTERIRLLGIDTPESVSTNTPEQCFGVEASLALKGLVREGDPIILSADVERRDRYGRMLVYAHTSDGVFINHWLLAGGFADVLIYEPNIAMRSEFTATRNLARSNSAGLWGVCDGPDQPLS